MSIMFIKNSILYFCLPQLVNLNHLFSYLEIHVVLIGFSENFFILFLFNFDPNVKLDFIYILEKK